MSEQVALIPVEEKIVEFYGDSIPAAVVITHQTGERQIYVPVRPLCEFLGVAWSPQRRRIFRDPILAEAMTSVTMTVTEMGQKGTMLCLPLDYLNGWLFGIDSTRVKNEIREQVLRYQRECYKILAAAFTQQPVPTDTSASTAALIQIRETALAVARLADEQLAMSNRLNKAAIIVGEHSRRLTALEKRLEPQNAINDEQAADIAEKVKALAMFLTEKDNTKNHFQGIFAELHRRFRVSSYKTIRQEQYQPVLDFLDNWATAAAKDQLPLSSS